MGLKPWLAVRLSVSREEITVSVPLRGNGFETTQGAAATGESALCFRPLAG